MTPSLLVMTGLVVIGLFAATRLRESDLVAKTKLEQVVEPS